MIAHGGTCFRVDGVEVSHEPIQLVPGTDLLTLTVEGKVFAVNPCRHCGALICVEAP